ncbi:MAG TPA: hypothetical protein VFE70_04420 [Candidatus Elarobacter sp.]|nr:hypothetical protein [Candidatus Elarobacter sp.]
MKYMLLIYVQPQDRDPTPEEWAATMPAWEAFGNELRARNALVDAAPLAGVASATTVRIRDGKRVVTDGPFSGGRATGFRRRRRHGSSPLRAIAPSTDCGVNAADARSSGGWSRSNRCSAPRPQASVMRWISFRTIG